ncbi:hypothetical protein ACR5KS_12490 [Leucobacter sp. W1153]|uniref:hypothetical protein n=1 Tax=Leucobacter sp. W1153 TaxID=3439064 RepID=UPI003F3B55FE
MTDTMNLRVLTLNIWGDPRDRGISTPPDQRAWGGLASAAEDREPGGPEHPPMRRMTSRSRRGSRGAVGAVHFYINRFTSRR